jgi:hypothetical protein
MSLSKDDVPYENWKEEREQQKFLTALVYRAKKVLS